ncbi:MAG TPA: aromatic ring-hydroxylating dioxygenase subunit alpha [Candidatus Acidoferrum sp.]|nr:aromatic ring-hydroxylating dioxygenase subunit alpha [Candidatus Acidoferrum sp.]
MTTVIASERSAAAVPDDFGPGWYAIASTRELRRDRPLALTRFGHKLVAFRANGEIGVLFDRCPHRGVQLSAGSVQDGQLACPFHGFRFDHTGACVQIPVQPAAAVIPKALRCRSLPAREQHGFIFAWWGAVPDSLPAIDWFDDELRDCDGPYEHSVDSDVGLSRNIENQLDMAHLPFVHGKSLGRLVKSPIVEVDCTVNGQRLRMTKRGSTSGFFIELRLPGLWINRIGANSWVFLAFAPITPTRTRLYTRYYQGSFKVPVLKKVLGWFMGWSNLWILREDLRVVHTHDTPVSPRLDGSELLLPFDIAAIEYRRLREQWLRGGKAD